MLKFTDQETVLASQAIDGPSVDVSSTDNVEAPKTRALSSEEMGLLAKKFASRKPEDKEWARERLKTLDVSALIALMAEQRVAQKRRLKVSLGVYVSAAAAGSILAITFHAPVLASSWSPICIAIFIAAAAFTGLQKSGATALTGFDDVRAVGELIAALEIRDEEVLAEVRPALIRLLPQLRASDGNLIDTEQRTKLRKYMDGSLHGRFAKSSNEKQDEELRLACLKALEQVGDAGFVPIVSRWANGESSGSNWRVQEGAQECLAALKLLSDKSIDEQQLMRPSTIVESDEVRSLVRPAVGAASSDTNAQELLRSNSSEHQ